MLLTSRQASFEKQKIKNTKNQKKKNLEISRSNYSKHR